MRDKFLAKSEITCLSDVVLLFYFRYNDISYLVIIRYTVRMNKKNISY